MWNNTLKNGSTRAFSYQYPPSAKVSPYVSTKNRSKALRYPSPSRAMNALDPPARRIAVVNRAMVRLLSARLGFFALGLSAFAAGAA
jgi:hypothetical protein